MSVTYTQTDVIREPAAQRPPVPRTFKAQPEIREPEVTSHPKLLKDGPEATGPVGALPQLQHAKILTALVCGALFGFVVHKGDVFRASVIRDQFNFTDWTLLKVFTTAILTSILVMTGMNQYQKTRSSVVSVAEEYNQAQIGLISSAVGGFLVGIGAAICGTCPSLSWVQLGAGSPTTLATIAGGIAGALLFGIQHERIISRMNRFMLLPSKSIGDYFGVKPLVGTIGLSAILLAGIAYMEARSPSVYPTFLNSVFGISAKSWLPSLPRLNFLTSARWDPVMVGILIGLLQIPLVTILGKHLGTSSAYVTLSSVLHPNSISAPNTYLGKHRTGLSNWWQVLFVLSAVGGSYLAYATSNTDLLYDISHDGVPLYKAFLGGAAMVVGARLAGGCPTCPSGIGLSDLGHTTLQWVTAVAAMLGGGHMMMQMMYVPITFSPGKPVFNNKDL